MIRDNLARRRWVALGGSVLLHFVILFLGVSGADKSKEEVPPIVTVELFEAPPAASSAPAAQAPPPPPVDEMVIPKLPPQKPKKIPPKKPPEVIPPPVQNPVASSDATGEGPATGATNNSGTGTGTGTGTGDAGPNAILGVTAKPDAANNPKPRYPDSSRRREEEGTVMLSVVVSVTGEALSVDIQTSSGFSALDNSAVETVKQWKFTPGLVQGVAVQSKIRIPVRFVLEE